MVVCQDELGFTIAYLQHVNQPSKPNIPGNEEMKVRLLSVLSTLEDLQKNDMHYGGFTIAKGLTCNKPPKD